MTDTTAPRTTGAVAAGLATIAADGTVLDTWFPAPELADQPGPSGTERLSAERAAELLGGGATAAIGPDARRGVEVVAVRTVIASLDEKPIDAHDTYLRLHLLSHRLVKPHGQSLDGIFGFLANVAWTSLGPVAVDDRHQRPRGHRIRMPGQQLGDALGPLGGDGPQGGPAQGGQVQLVLQLHPRPLAREPLPHPRGEFGGQIGARVLQTAARGDHLGEALVGLPQRVDQQLVEGLEVVRRRAQRHIGLGGGTAVAQTGDPLRPDDPDRRVDDPLAPLGVVAPGHQWAPPRFSTTTPTMIRAMPAALATVMPSPMNAIPIVAMAAVPTPAQMA